MCTSSTPDTAKCGGCRAKGNLVFAPDKYCLGWGEMTQMSLSQVV